MTKTILIAGAGLLVVYLLVTRGGGGSLFSFAGPQPGQLPTTSQPPYSSGPGTRYADANVWSFLTGVGTSVVNALGTSSSSSSSSSSSKSTSTPKYTNDLLTPTWV